MSSHLDNTILGLPRRPRLGDASASAILGAIAGGLLPGNLAGALVGGVSGSALANRPQPLEMAVRQRFATEGFEVVFFHRAPRAVKVTFRYRPTSFWTVESVIPDPLILSPDDADDWLYGHLISHELPDVLQQIAPLTA